MTLNNDDSEQLNQQDERMPQDSAAQPEAPVEGESETADAQNVESQEPSQSSQSEQADAQTAEFGQSSQSPQPNQPADPSSVPQQQVPQGQPYQQYQPYQPYGMPPAGYPQPQAMPVQPQAQQQYIPPQPIPQYPRYQPNPFNQQYQPQFQQYPPQLQQPQAQPQFAAPQYAPQYQRPQYQAPQPQYPPQYPQNPGYPPFGQQGFPPFMQTFQMLPQQWHAYWEGKRRINLAKHDYSLVGWALVLMIAVWLFGSTLVSGIISFAGDNGAKISGGLTLLLSNLPLYAIAMPLSLLLFRQVPRLAVKEFDMPVGTFVKLFIATFPVMGIGSILGNLCAAPFSNDNSDSLDSILGDVGMPWLFLLTCICAPIFEEWIFRKEIISRTRKYGEKTAIVVSALCFGLFHGNIRQFFYAFGLGLILGYIYVRTSKLWYSMLMHGLVNFCGGVVSTWVTSQIDTAALDKAVESNNEGAIMNAIKAQSTGFIIFGVYLLILLALFIVGIVILVRERKHFVLFTAPMELPQGSGAKTAFGNAGMIVFIVVGALMTVATLALAALPTSGLSNGDTTTGTILLQTVSMLV